MAQQFPNPKNLVKVSKLKQMVDSLKKENYATNRIMELNSPEDNSGEPDTESLKKISFNNAKINKYTNLIKNAKRYKVGM